jgi:hypothetical protein
MQDNLCGFVFRKRVIAGVCRAFAPMPKAIDRSLSQRLILESSKKQQTLPIMKASKHRPSALEICGVPEPMEWSPDTGQIYYY